MVCSSKPNDSTICVPWTGRYLVQGAAFTLGRGYITQSRRALTTTTVGTTLLSSLGVGQPECTLVAGDWSCRHEIFLAGGFSRCEVCLSPRHNGKVRHSLKPQVTHLKVRDHGEGGQESVVLGGLMVDPSRNYSQTSL